MEEFRRIFELPEIRTAVVSASFEAKACCIAYLPFNHHLSTILLPSSFQHIWFWNATPPKESAKICKAAAFLLSLFSLALARTWLSAQDLQVTDPDILFKLLDDGDKQLTAESFLQLQHLQYADVRSIKHEHCHFALRKSWLGAWIG